MMYWMVIGNHVMTIQSRSLTTKHLEQYLTWLLKERTAQMAQNGHVLLTAKFDSAEVGGDLEDIREIIVGGTGAVEAAPARLPHPPVAEREVDQHVDVGARRSWGERAIKVLQAVMNNEADVQNLLESIPEDADLDVSVHIGYKTKKRRVTRAPMQQALRNLPDGEIVNSDEGARQLRDNGAHQFLDDAAPRNGMMAPGSWGLLADNFLAPETAPGQEAIVLLARARRMLSPVSSMRWALWTRRSRMASA